MKLIASILSGAGKAWHAAWTSPLVLFSAFLIAWGAEAAQFLMSQGLALAILAWLQTLPEFAVEATLAWTAGRGTGHDVHMVTANFTGSIRLIMGFGMPMVYFIFTRFWSKANRNLRPIVLDRFHSVEVISLFPPVVYFAYIIHKGTLDLIDAVVLLGFYALYLGLLLKMPPEEEEDISELPYVSRVILRRGRVGRILGCVLVFVLGGALLFFTVHEFIEGLESLAILLGVPAFFFIQWVAPFLSEMPEKVSAFSWAAKENRAAMALMNFLSSNVNQLTVLVAMVPIVFAISVWTAPPVDPKDPEYAQKIEARKAQAALPMPTVVFDGEQKSEVLLTIAQTLLCLVLLLNMRFEWQEALGMFLLFFVQFLSPLWSHTVGWTNDAVRSWCAIAYLAWVALEVLLFVARVRRWQFPMLARPSITIFRRRTAGPSAR